MKLTQTIKNWLHKMFAWWPWKQPTQFEYSNAGTPPNKGMVQDTLSRPPVEGIAPQTGMVPRLSTVEEWPERVVKSEYPGLDEFAETRSLTPAPSDDEETTRKSAASADETFADTHSSPSPLQRLEFLRFLVKRGIINEGFEEDE